MINIDTLRAEAKEYNSVPKYNGLGMVRLRLGDRGYLFYSERAPAINHTIHNHRYDFNSLVIKGTIRNHLYDITVVEHEADFKLTWKDMVLKNDNAGETIHPNIELIKTCTFDTVEGEEYFLHKKIFHGVERITEKLITCMHPSSLSVDYSQKALFLIDKRIPYVGVYSQPKSPEECWEIIEYTLND